MNILGWHHFHRRKRIHLKLEPYPSSDRAKNLMDRVIYFAAMIVPVMTLVQLVEIIMKGNASGISVIAWIGYTVAGIFWLAYGIMHREKPIIVTYSFLTVMNVGIVIAAMIYG
jgi:uncharacterized protein with PQ loop repeat